MEVNASLSSLVDMNLSSWCRMGGNTTAPEYTHQASARIMLLVGKYEQIP